MTVSLLSSMPVLHEEAHQWSPSPIDPDWIVAGSPEAEVMQWAAGSDERSSAFVWRCSPGTFRWRFAVDEYVHVISGRAELRHPDGTVDQLRPGTAALFRAGDTVEWTITEPLTKCAVLVSPLPAPVRPLLRAARRTVARIRTVAGR